MSFEIAVVGHGDFPNGIASALKLLIGTNEHLTLFNLNEQTTHQKFTENMHKFLEENDDVVVFADMMGGAPHQITAKEILEINKPNQYIVGSAPLSLILDVYSSVQMDLTEKNANQKLIDAVKQTREMIQIMPIHDDNIDCGEIQENMADDEEDGI